MRNSRFATVVALGLILLSTAVVGRAQVAGQASTEAATVPADDQPSKEQLAKLFELMRVRNQMTAMMKALPVMMQQQIANQIKTMKANLPNGATITPDQEASIDKLMGKYMQKAVELYPAEEMISDMSAIYQRHLSREDVDALIVFYSSPAGQHLLDMTPTILKEYMPMVMDRMATRSKALTEEMMKEMKSTVPAMANEPALK
ncbi:DUF2059 domain-containing protein [Acidicapsa ligni]|uniref:DUF2059 domain-containing protein n=1 Tax=Acidicapsa ligni TaxID=542300 RepID=UPI0021E04397|nr:DUF2059 domain-containing protein [Acidicapsa ligni]